MFKQTSAKARSADTDAPVTGGGADARGIEASMSTHRQDNPSNAQIASLIDLCTKDQLFPALSAGTQLLARYPKSAPLYKILGNINDLLGQADAAMTCYASAIALDARDAEAYNVLGRLLRDQGETQKAATCFDRAIAIVPNSVAGYLNMGDTLFNHGDFIRAADYYMEALRIEPGHKAIRYNLAQSLKNLRFTTFVPRAAEMFVRILDVTPLVRPEDLAPAGLSLVKVEPTFVAAMARFEKGMLNENLAATLSELGQSTLLLRLMTLCPLPDVEIEELFRQIRAALLFQASNLDTSPAITRFCEALSIQTFINEYVYDQSAAETAEVCRLDRVVGEQLRHGVQPDHATLLSLASYKRLYEFEWYKNLQPTAALSRVLECQVSEQECQIQLRETIPTLKNVSNEVSVDVRSQYEEHPYPRWRNCGVYPAPFMIADLPDMLDLRIQDASVLACSAPDILIAGSGTGRTTVESARNYKDSRVLAVDLSLSSLTYAKHQAMSLGLDDIDFLQADLLDLDSLGRQFDLIESTGVLHHMADPMAGWQVLARCLRPGGLMKIGLYSALARQHIVKIREENLGSPGARDIAELRSLRSDLLHSDQEHHRKVTLSSDFFSASAFRDLVCHVQEHRFTIPQIKNCLDSLGLEFCGFEGSDLQRRFIEDFGEKSDLYDLDAWHIFEKAHPDSFFAMYQFWCQKV